MAAAVTWGVAAAASLGISAATASPGVTAAASTAATANAAANPGTAATTPPADIIKTRRQALKALDDATKLVRDQLRGHPDPARIKAAAADIKKAAAALNSWFPPGTGPESGLNTDAKVEIWRDPAGFAAASGNLTRQADRLLQVADSGDTTALNDAFRSVAQSCKGCHDDYRARRLTL
jgi:cytochrome c556